jgi:hypothetical protein
VGLVVEDTERGNRRERWWRAAHDITSWSSVDFRDDPEDRAAEGWLAGHIARQHAQWLQDWIDTRGAWSKAWVDASDVTDIRLHLTTDQLHAMVEEVHGVIQRYREQANEAGAEQVTVMFHAFPHPEPSL